MRKQSETLRDEWRALAPNWIHEARVGRNANREGLLDSVVLEACGDIRGRQFLDCGCGEGRFCRLLAQRGAAYVLGLDLCEPMIEAARQLESEVTSYRVADVQDLSFLEDDWFDVAVSYLNQCDLPDFRANTAEVFRVLRPGGRFVVANLHPMRSAAGGWQKDEAGTKQHVILDRYFEEGARHWTMMGVEVTNFHRTLETYISCFLDSGFIVGRIVEPTVSQEILARYPELADEQRVPNFILYVLEKPAVS